MGDLLSQSKLRSQVDSASKMKFQTAISRTVYYYTLKETKALRTNP